MKRYRYDGSLDGLFTLIFDHYKEIGQIEIIDYDMQIDFFETKYVVTDLLKSQRVIKSIEDNMGKNFLQSIIDVYKSKYDKKDMVIANVIKGCFYFGDEYINSEEKSAVEFRSIIRNYSHELHAYKGLLRFYEIEDNYLIAEFEPENDILEYLAIHFIKRMPNEKFLIYDVNRKKAILSIKGNYEKVEISKLDAIESDEEKIFKEARKVFYKSISIKKRENKKLMQDNMPKKYWKYLPEKK